MPARLTPGWWAPRLPPPWGRGHSAPRFTGEETEARREASGLHGAGFKLSSDPETPSSSGISSADLRSREQWGPLLPPS